MTRAETYLNALALEDVYKVCQNRPKYQTDTKRQKKEKRNTFICVQGLCLAITKCLSFCLAEVYHSNHSIVLLVKIGAQGGSNKVERSDRY
jgi:hypothetical protein